MRNSLPALLADAGGQVVKDLALHVKEELASHCAVSGGGNWAASRAEKDSEARAAGEEFSHTQRMKRYSHAISHDT